MRKKSALMSAFAALMLTSGCVQEADDEGAVEDAEFSADMGAIGDAAIVPVPDMGLRPDFSLSEPDGAVLVGGCDGVVEFANYQTLMHSGQAGAGQMQGSCGGRGFEQVVSFTAPEAGEWYFTTAVPETAADTVLYALTDCERPGSELACNDDSNGIRSTIRVPLEAGATIFVVVDSFGRDGTGAFGMQAGLVGAVDLGDACDDGTRICAENLLCWPMHQGPGGNPATCQEVRPRADGESCDPFGDRIGACIEGLACLQGDGGFDGVCATIEVRQIGEDCSQQNADIQRCVAGSVCYWSNADVEQTVCTEVRERQLGETCDPFRDQVGPCADGLGCQAENDPRWAGECVEVRARAEGERCDRDGQIAPCADGLACRQLGDGFDDLFCVPIEVLEVGAICSVDESTGRCVEGTFCIQQQEGAPRCAEVGVACPDGWVVGELIPNDAGFFAQGNTGENTVETPVCDRNSAAANVYRFTPPAPGRWVFETVADGEPFDTIISLRQRCVLPQSRLDCNDDSGEDFYSRMTVDLVSDDEVYLFVGGFGRGAGMYRINVRMAD